MQANDPTLELLRTKIREEMNVLADDISAGGCANIEEYRQSTGRILGLAWTERELLDLDERLGEN
jgi:hypothetical protein